MTLSAWSLWVNGNGSWTQLDWTEWDFLNEYISNKQQSQWDKATEVWNSEWVTLDWNDDSFDTTWPPLKKESVQKITHDTANAVIDLSKSHTIH